MICCNNLWKKRTLHVLVSLRVDISHLSPANPIITQRSGVVLSYIPAHDSNGINFPSLLQNFSSIFSRKSRSEKIHNSLRKILHINSSQSWTGEEPRVQSTRGSGAAIQAAPAHHRRWCRRRILNHGSVLLPPVSPPSNALKTSPLKPPHSVLLVSWRLKPSTTTTTMTISISVTVLRLLPLFPLSPVTEIPVLMLTPSLRFPLRDRIDLLLLR